MSEKKENAGKPEQSCECFADARTKKTCPPVRKMTHPLRYYEFTQEEMKVLEECDRESFFKRCVPFSALLATITYAAIKNGRLKPNPRFGPFPKVTLAVMVGYFIGKLSYQQACAEKLMALPGSYIGQLLRERKDGKIGGRSPMAPKGNTMLGANPSDIYSDAGPGSSLDLDTDRPLFNEEAYRSDSQASPPPEIAPRHVGPNLSYDDLRRKNRGDFKDSKQDPYRTDLGPPPPGQRVRAPAPALAPTNKYGDTME